MRREIYTEEDGSTSIYTYDEQDHHVRTTDYDANGQRTCDIVYEYDLDGNISGWRVYRAGGQLLKQFVRRYNEQGLMEQFQYDAAGKLELRKVETYDENNRLVELTFDPDGHPLSD